MSDEPSLTGSNGRDRSGRFSANNKFAKGNPHSRRVNQLRAALMRSVDEGDIEKAIAALIKKAHAGDVVAIRELLDRYFGRPATHDLTARVEVLEQQLLGESHENE